MYYAARFRTIPNSRFHLERCRHEPVRPTNDDDDDEAAGFLNRLATEIDSADCMAILENLQELCLTGCGMFLRSSPIDARLS